MVSWTKRRGCKDAKGGGRRLCGMRKADARRDET
jgi:hypothetical protein